MTLRGRPSRSDLGLALLVALGVFAAIAPRTQRDIGWVDSVEFALAGLVFGIPHPTGYPLYTLLAHLAAAVAGRVGSEPALAVNLLSTLFGAVAAGGAFLLARAIGLGRLPALAAAVLLAGSRELVAQSTVAEVYTLHLALVSLLLVAALAAAAGGRGLWIAAFLLGLGLAHHLTIALAAPALLVLAAPRLRAALGGRQLLALGLALATPLTLYALLPIRSAADPVLDLGDPETLERLIAHVSGRQFSYRLLTSEPVYMLRELAGFLHLLAAQWSLAATAWIALGAIVLLKRSPFHRRVLLALLLLAGATVAHAISYRIPDKSAYYLPAYLAAALLAGAAADWLLAAGARSRPLRLGLAAGVVVLAALPGIASRQATDRHADHSLRDLAREVARRTPPTSLIITDDTSLAFALLYLGATSDEFAGRTVVAQYLLPLEWYAAQLSAVDPRLPAEAAARRAARRHLAGRALGDRLAADARALAASLAERRLAAGRVFVYGHDFAVEQRSFGGLPLADRGLVYEVVTAAGPARPDVEFARFDAYRPEHRRTLEEGAVARRFAAAANRAGIASVHRGETTRAEAEFQDALALDPGYAQAWLNLGLLYADYLRRPAAARAAWQRYLDLALDSREAAAVRERLAGLGAGADSGPGVPLDTTTEAP